MSKHRSSLRSRLEFWLYLAVRRTAFAVGPRCLAWLGGLFGDLYWLCGRARRRILDFNLGFALPELAPADRRRLSRRVAQHFGRITLDALRLQRLEPEQLLREVTIEGRHNLHEGLAAGRGVFLLSAHIGSWEVAALVAGLIVPNGFSVINRPLDNPLLEAELGRFRGRFGNHALGKARITRDMLRQLKAGGAVGILIDQRAQKKEGIEVPFFGHPSWTHPVLARMCLRTLAPVVPIWGLWAGPARYTVRFGEPVFPERLAEAERDEVALTARFCRITEEVIRERPHQWLWYHDRWRHLRTSRE